MYGPWDCLSGLFELPPFGLKPVAQCPCRIAVVCVVLANCILEYPVQLRSFAKFKRMLDLPQGSARIFEWRFPFKSVERFERFERIMLDARADSPPRDCMQVHQ